MALLRRDGALIVDARCFVFLWLGKRCRPRHARRAARAAEDYAAATRGDSNVDVQRQGSEAPRFKALFHGWADAESPTHRERRSSELLGRVVDSSDSSSSDDEAPTEPKRRHSCGF